MKPPTFGPTPECKYHGAGDDENPGFLWSTNGGLMGLLWFYYGLLWVSYGFTRVYYGLLWVYYGLLWLYYGFSRVLPGSSGFFLIMGRYWYWEIDGELPSTSTVCEVENHHPEVR